MLLWEHAAADARLPKGRKCVLPPCMGTDLVALHCLDDLARLLSESVPFYLRHKSETDRFQYYALVTEVAVRGGRLAFKVLYPYDAFNVSVGSLYTTLGAVSSRMYADYGMDKAKERGMSTSAVATPISNGWEHLLASLPCGDTEHEHAPFQACVPMMMLVPPLVRDALSNGRPAQYNRALLPPRLHVQHSLDLDHLLASPSGARSRKKVASVKDEANGLVAAMHAYLRARHWTAAQVGDCLDEVQRLLSGSGRGADAGSPNVALHISRKRKKS